MRIVEELKRRNVFRVAVAYVVGGWMLIQVLELAADAFEAPAWVMKMIMTVVVLGFIPTLLFAWAFELTPEGVKRERDVVRDESTTNETAKKLDIITLVAVLGIAVIFAWQQFGSDNSPVPSTVDANDLPAATEFIPELPRLGEQSIAIVPFANRSNLDDDLFFTDGIHDDLLTQLAKIHDLKVISRTSVMEYRGTTKGIPEIAHELGVAKVLEGGVQRAGPRVRINAKLFDVATEGHLWAESFDREMTIDNLFDIQSEITRQIVTAVKGEMSDEEQLGLPTAPTQNVEAYEAYLQARELIVSSGYNMEKYKAAQPFVEQAIAKDPNFGLAHLRLAEIHGMAYWIGYDVTPERRQAAKDGLDLAAELLGPDSPELLSAQGQYFYRFEQNYPAALNAFLKAHAAMPGKTEVLVDLGLTQRRLGLWDESVASLLQAAELDPAVAASSTDAVETLLTMRQWARAEDVLRSATESFSDDIDLAAQGVMLPLWSKGDVKTARERYDEISANSGEAYWFVATELPWFERNFAGVIETWSTPEVKGFALTEGYAGFRELTMAQAYQQLGDADRAEQLLAEAVQDLAEVDRNRRDVVIANDLSTLAMALALQGEKERAIAIAEEATQVHTLASDKLEGTAPLVWLCFVLGVTGERDRALEIIEQLIDEPAGFVRWVLYLDPRWDFFRDDKRFNDLIRPHNLEQSEYATEGGAPR